MLHVRRLADVEVAHTKPCCTKSITRWPFATNRAYGSLPSYIKQSSNAHNKAISRDLTNVAILLLIPLRLANYPKLEPAWTLQKLVGLPGVDHSGSRGLLSAFVFFLPGRNLVVRTLAG